MLKKLLIVLVVVGVAGFIIVNTHAVSYIRTAGGYVADSAQEAVPIEFQIDRARNMIKDLVPEVRKNMHIIAKEEVEVARLEEQISDSETKLAKDKDQILKLKSDLAQKKSVYQYASRTYTPDEVRGDLSNRFERFKTSDATVASLKEILRARQKSLEAARSKLEGMLAAKRQLQVDVENLEARSQMIAAAQTTSKYQFDDSQLGNVKELVAGLRNRLEVAEKLVNAEVNFRDEIPVSKPSADNVEEQVTEYFTPSPKATAVASNAAKTPIDVDAKVESKTVEATAVAQQSK